LLVTYINRAKRLGNYSMEGLFEGVQKQLSLNFDIIIKNYHAPIGNRMIGIIEASKLESDIFHITGDVNFLSLGLPKAKTILTIHDLGFYENAEHSKLVKLIYKWLWLKIPIHKVGFITTVSQFTKNKILEYFPIDENKIVVINNPSFIKKQNNVIKYSNVKKRILQIGTGKHKNLMGLINAVKGLNVLLDIVGTPHEHEYNLLSEYGIDFLVSNDLTNEEIARKYQLADILFFASFHEGFGMPIIEANQLGTPVITSNICSMPEVAREAALIVDPYSTDQIKKAIEHLLNDNFLRKKLITAGFLNARIYDENKICGEYYNLYKKVMNGD
jgi:glycosyltransferase involved in cell wall biosynthesis